MAKNEKKVSITLFDKIAKEHFDNNTTIQWHDVEVKVKRSLSLMDVLAFVDDVVDSCFHEQYGYMPEVKDFVIKTNILSRYANFSLPDNLEHRYQMVYFTDAVDTVCGAINTTQLQEIVDAIDEKIQLRCNTRIAEVQKRIDQVVEAIEDMGHKTEALFSGVTQDDMKTLMSAIAESGLDEQKIVKAYMEQKKAEQQGAETGEPAAEEGSAQADDAS